MKIRTDFVTNSSSSSFTISTDCLTTEQILKMQNYDRVAEELNLDYWEDAAGWHITFEDEEIRGYTSMDNFDFKDFFRAIGVDPGMADWDW